MVRISVSVTGPEELVVEAAEVMMLTGALDGVAEAMEELPEEETASDEEATAELDGVAETMELLPEMIDEETRDEKLLNATETEDGVGDATTELDTTAEEEGVADATDEELAAGELDATAEELVATAEELSMAEDVS